MTQEWQKIETAPTDGFCLAYIKVLDCKCGWACGDTFILDLSGYDAGVREDGILITHWMPLPNPPEAT